MSETMKTASASPFKVKKINIIYPAKHQDECNEYAHYSGTSKTLIKKLFGVRRVVTSTAPISGSEMLF